MPEINATHAWASNAELIEDCARLGYLQADWYTLDPTYGEGTFWKQWRPFDLHATDLDPTKSPKAPQNFTALPMPDNWFDAVIFDPPYKLNGTPSTPDERYGAAVPTRWQDRLQLIHDGLMECARVYNGVGYLLVKCQDQVCSGAVRWQSDLVTEWAGIAGLKKVDRFDLLGGRKQPPGRRQVHARRNTSQLLVFKG